MHFKLTLIALLAPTLSTAAVIPRDDLSVQIVGGVAASAGEFPYIVSLQVSSRHFCGGSLINANTVVTAAHCAEAYSASSITIRAGSLSTSSGGVTSRVTRSIINPAYSGNNNDIAILKLTTSIPTSSTIGYATLPASGSDPAAGSSSTVAGWGATSEGGSGTTTLRKVDIPIVSRTTCRSQYGTSAITNNMICAAETQGGQDSCQGDSGGPLVPTGSNTLIGVVSFGNGCARAGYAGVYTRVSTQLSFINANA